MAVGRVGKRGAPRAFCGEVVLGMCIGALSVIGVRGHLKGKIRYTAGGRRVEGNRLAHH